MSMDVPSYIGTLDAAWRSRVRDDDAVVEQVPELPRSPAARREALYQQNKASLSRAWLAPQRAPAPWEEPTRSPGQPRYWNDPPLDPVTVVTEPAATNPAKGAGVSLTPEEIERFRAGERAAFAERLRERWKWNLAHL